MKYQKDRQKFTGPNKSILFIRFPASIFQTGNQILIAPFYFP